jgi:hypothetical protein
VAVDFSSQTCGPNLNVGKLRRERGDLPVKSADFFAELIVRGVA